MDKIRASMKAEASFLKRLVDEVMADNVEEVNSSKSLIIKLIRQDKIYEEYNDYLQNLVKEYNGYMSIDKVQYNPIIFLLSEQLKINPIPESKVPVYSVLNVCRISKEQVSKLLSNITVPPPKPKIREINPLLI